MEQYRVAYGASPPLRCHVDKNECYNIIDVVYECEH